MSHHTAHHVPITNKFVYLAGAIDSAVREGPSEWRNRASVILARYGYAAFNPFSAYGGNVEKSLHSYAIMNINRAALDNCQFVMARFSDEFTIGTIREIEYARTRLIPVYLYTENKMILEKLRRAISAYDCHVIEETLLGDAIALIHQAEELRNRPVIMLDEPMAEEDDRSGS